MLIISKPDVMAIPAHGRKDIRRLVRLCGGMCCGVKTAVSPALCFGDVVLLVTSVLTPGWAVRVGGWYEGTEPGGGGWDRWSEVGQSVGLCPRSGKIRKNAGGVSMFFVAT